jgi:DNA topoisomerase-1
MERFWGPFKELVTDKSESLDRTDAGSARVLGPDPVSGKDVTARIGRFGPMVQIGTVEDEEKPKFASLQPGQSIYSISLDEALKLFDMPRKLGADANGEEVTVGIGRFGPFAKRGSTYASLTKEDDPYKIDLARAVFLIEEKEEIARNRIIKEFEGSDIQVLNGRFGPYISDGKMNGKIPKDREPASLTLAEVEQLMADTGKPVRKGFGKKAAKKTTVKKEATPKKAAAKKAPAKKAATKKAATKKTAAKKATKKTVAKKAVKKSAADDAPPF